MYCKHCGNQIEQSSRFCQFCGGQTVTSAPSNPTPLHNSNLRYSNFENVKSSPKRKIGIWVASEIKRSLIYIQFALVVGILSFPIFYFLVYGVNDLQDGKMPTSEQFAYAKINLNGSIGSYYDTPETIEYNRKIFIKELLLQLEKQ